MPTVEIDSSTSNGRGSDTPTTSDVEQEWKSAKNCFRRKGYPVSISPPTGAQEEARRRYGAAANTGGVAIAETRKGGQVGGCGPESTNNSLEGGESSKELSHLPHPPHLSSHSAGTCVCSV